MFDDEKTLIRGDIQFYSLIFILFFLCFLAVELLSVETIFGKSKQLHTIEMPLLICNESTADGEQQQKIKKRQELCSRQSLAIGNHVNMRCDKRSNGENEKWKFILVELTGESKSCKSDERENSVFYGFSEKRRRAENEE